MFIHEEQFIFPCELPPSDNNLTRSGRFGKYPTQDYRDWLETQAPILDEYLEGWTPDPSLWWRLDIYLWLKTGDGSNRVKAAQDLLAGRRFDAKTRKITDGHGLFVNDKQVRGVNVWIDAIRDPNPRCQIEAICVEGPVDAKAHAVAAEKAAAREAKARAAAERAEKLRALLLEGLAKETKPVPLSQMAYVIGGYVPDGELKRTLEALKAESLVVKGPRGWELAR